MAGIIDIRYDHFRREWTAKPRFAYDAESYAHGAPSFTAPKLDQAFYGLCELLPVEMSRQLRLHFPRHMYASPERDLGSNDKCIEVDGHCPSQAEFNERHFRYMRTR